MAPKKWQPPVGSAEWYFDPQAGPEGTSNVAAQQRAEDDPSNPAVDSADRSREPPLAPQNQATRNTLAFLSQFRTNTFVKSSIEVQGSDGKTKTETVAGLQDKDRGEDVYMRDGDAGASLVVGNVDSEDSDSTPPAPTRETTSWVVAPELRVRLGLASGVEQAASRSKQVSASASKPLR